MPPPASVFFSANNSSLLSSPLFFRLSPPPYPNSGQPSNGGSALGVTTRRRSYDDAVETRLVRVFFREVEAPSAPSTPVSVSATGKLLQFRRRRLLSPGCEAAIDAFRLWPLEIGKGFVVVTFGVGELRFGSGEPRSGSPVIARNGGDVTPV
ncbi:hypothetical protein Rs2_31222 [Raphanus sativus]|nr:hypothetical protein Rs2_31222 [Raphanus sativus]